MHPPVPPASDCNCAPQRHDVGFAAFDGAPPTRGSRRTAFFSVFLPGAAQPTPATLRVATLRAGLGARALRSLYAEAKGQRSRILCAAVLLSLCGCGHGQQPATAAQRQVQAPFVDGRAPGAGAERLADAPGCPAAPVAAETPPDCPVGRDAELAQVDGLVRFDATVRLGDLPAGAIAYNPAIVPYGAGAIVAMRIDRPDQDGRWSQLLGATVLDANFAQVGPTTLFDLREAGIERHTTEDPRLVWHQGRLLMVYNGLRRPVAGEVAEPWATDADGPVVRSMHLAELDFWPADGASDAGEVDGNDRVDVNAVVDANAGVDGEDEAKASADADPNCLAVTNTNTLAVPDTDTDTDVSGGAAWASDRSVEAASGNEGRAPRERILDVGAAFAVHRKAALRVPADMHARPIEKNWAPFVWTGKLHFVYNVNPHVILRMPDDAWDDGIVALEHVTHRTLAKAPQRVDAPGPARGWFSEEMRGGTGAIYNPDKGVYEAFFHGRTATITPCGLRLLLSIGYYAFSPEPPFDVIRVTPLPIAVPDLDATAKPQLHCAYPGGFLERDGTYYVAYGRNDSALGLLALDGNVLAHTAQNVEAR